MAQEQKNEKAKNAFGIREDFVPGSSVSSMSKTVEKAQEGAITKVGFVMYTIESSRLMLFVIGIKNILTGGQASWRNRKGGEG